MFLRTGIVVSEVVNSTHRSATVRRDLLACVRPVSEDNVCLFYTCNIHCKYSLLWYFSLGQTAAGGLAFGFSELGGAGRAFGSNPESAILLDERLQPGFGGPTRGW